MNIVLLESLGISEELLETYAARLRERGHSFVAYPRDTDPDIQIERAKDADIVIVANMPLTSGVICAIPHLKYIDIAFTGVDHVDIAAARELGIAVSNASGYSTDSVAELALGLILSLLRKVPQVSQRARQSKTKDGLVGSELKGKTVGIVGLGAIGSRVAQLAQAFGCRVLGYRRNLAKGSSDGIELVSLDDLLKRSDIITLHCPLTPETRGLIGKDQVALMKPSAIVINTARGPVVDSAALADALNSGAIAGAGIDVFETEPPLDVNHPLLHSQNTLVTPHVAFASVESMVTRAEIIFDNIDSWLEGNQKNIVA